MKEWKEWYKDHKSIPLQEAVFQYQQYMNQQQSLFQTPIQSHGPAGSDQVVEIFDALPFGLPHDIG